MGLDDFLMRGINGLVYSWNYLTGGTKTDLARILNGTAPIFEVSGGFCMTPILGAIMIAVSTKLTQINWNSFKDQEADEGRARNARARRNYGYDLENVVYGHFFSFCSLSNLLAANMSHPSSEVYNAKQELGSLGSYSVAFGNGLRALSFYIMRADDIPPGKNILSRAYDYCTGNSLQRQTVAINR
ncbi:MAG: hypothetical protein PHF67_01235 [Candidatus Nanoarchaeia archaeon]|nr:hypothetical protein [Candidatus Nanoarchaeia archaeon]